jgi:ATP-dependent DNA helicase RecG
MEEIQKGLIHNRRYRNRRIGDFLKELDMTEGRGTGIQIIRREMERNGSPEPRFETFENYSYFITTLPIHPAFFAEDEISEGVNKGAKTNDSQHDNILRLIREGVNEGVNENVYDIISILTNVAGLNAVEIASRTKEDFPPLNDTYVCCGKKKSLNLGDHPKLAAIT